MEITKIISYITVIARLTIDRSQSEKINRRVVRIANGRPLDYEHYPYVVGLKTENSDDEINFCTGTLISPVFVITAAHCIAETKTAEVYRYDPHNTTGEKRTVVEFFSHPSFNETSLVADLCILKINEPFDQVLSYANISGYPEMFANENRLQCSVLGWGKNQFDHNPSDVANIASVLVKYGPDACRVPPDNQSISNLVNQTWEWFLCSVPDSQMVCYGDSGGPLVCRGFLFGITSHGYNYHPGISNLTVKCGDDRVQARHIFIFKYRQWIDDIVNATSSTMKYNFFTFGFTFCLHLLRTILFQ